ncbi:Outer membrane porin F precursor [Actinomyces bovis]|uniref:Outer membrane porin F n=1 Tax=Actinomyces bovis TaxID=1658 RepID=A0ABY1VN34_9ACTO|nr:OmpA family protein [Actinomyces bovis]SPT53349.1 Outer membrane porin F precursor [Actinomyces bovis]VEG52718.1 Outer membrane porin F precursor [Actinomyces israelii]
MRASLNPMLSRRRALSVPLLAVLAGTLAACGDDYVNPTPSQPAPSNPAAPGTGGPGTTPGGSKARPAGGVTRIENLSGGHTIDVEVGPVIRVDANSSLLKIKASRPADDPGKKEQIYPPISETWVGNGSDENRGTRPLRLIDTANRRVWVTTHTDLKPVYLAKGKTEEMYFSFGGIDAGITKLIAMLVETGFFEVDVVEASTITGIDAPALLAACKPDANRGPSLPLEFFSKAYDGSSGGLTTEKDIQVTVSSDVTFATDSSELSSTADGALRNAADTIKSYANGGSITITGHTDDVADEAYNQTLSEKRAQSVQKRLSELADLSKWSVTTTGKGETEPRIKDTTDAARAINRRVDLVITPTGGTHTAVKPSDPNAALPAAKGVVGSGAVGVVSESPMDQAKLKLTLDQVTRRGQLLFGELLLTVEATGSIGSPALTRWLRDQNGGVKSVRGEEAGVSNFSTANGVTILSGGRYVYPVDYLPVGASAHLPLTDLDLSEMLGQGETMRVLMVWPDTGDSTITIDRHDTYEQISVDWRLTDIPVVEG